MNDHPPPRRTILVVEDECFIRMNAAEIVQDDGLEVLEASNAAEALEILRSHPEVAVLFTDIDMPGDMTGLELADRVHRQRPEIQLLVTSGRTRPKAAEIADNGVFLAKPYSADDLTSAIRALMAREGDAGAI